MLTKLRFHRLFPDWVIGACPCAFFPACRDIRGDAAFRHYHFWSRIRRVRAKGSKHPSKHSPRPDHLSRVFPQYGIIIFAQQCVVARHSQEDFASVVHDRSSRICIPPRLNLIFWHRLCPSFLSLTYPLTIPRK